MKILLRLALVLVAVLIGAIIAVCFLPASLLAPLVESKTADKVQLNGVSGRLVAGHAEVDVPLVGLSLPIDWKVGVFPPRLTLNIDGQSSIVIYAVLGGWDILQDGRLNLAPRFEIPQASAAVSGECNLVDQFVQIRADRVFPPFALECASVRVGLQAPAEVAIDLGRVKFDWAEDRSFAASLKGGAATGSMSGKLDLGTRGLKGTINGNISLPLTLTLLGVALPSRIERDFSFGNPPR